ncbi:MAG: ABC transporter substrate-binding protein [Cumulibacter sp.]
MRRLRTRATIGTVAGLLLAGCGDAPESTSKGTAEYPSIIEPSDDFDPDATFTFGYTAFPPSWDPTESTSSADRIPYSIVYDGLFIEKADNSTFVPGLATGYEPAEDGKSVTLTLREGLTFSDGTEFDADAVKFNLDRNRAEGSRLAGELYQVESVEVIDPLTVKINVSGGIKPLLTSLIGRAGLVVSPKAVADGVLKDKPVGIGPYVSTDIEPGVEATFERTPDYWEPEAQKVKTRVHRFIADDQTRYNALIAGEIDGAQINPDQLNAADDAGSQTLAKPSTLFLNFGMNISVEPFDNVEVRKALNMSIDREGIAKGLYDGHCTPQVQPFPEGGVGYSEEVGDGLDVYPFDPEQAKEILAEQGVTDLEFETVAPNVTIYTKFAEIVQENFAQAGVTVTVKSIPSQQLVQDYVIDKTASTTSSVTTGIIDPDFVWGSFVSPTASSNPGGKTDPDITKYAIEGANALEDADRTAAYAKMVDAWMANPPHIIPVCMIHLAAGYAPGVAGAAQNLSGMNDLRYVSVAPEE